MTLEMGKLIAQARGEVVLSADIFDYYAKNAERFLAPRRETMPQQPDPTIHGIHLTCLRG
jgi:acyl-CoA reductase-like NAD-dependent aldehyde dehydrogenase